MLSLNHDQFLCFLYPTPSSVHSLEEKSSGQRAQAEPSEGVVPGFEEGPERQCSSCTGQLGALEASFFYGCINTHTRHASVLGGGHVRCLYLGGGREKMH